MSFETVTQQAILAALTDHTPLTAPIYDNVPQDSAFPYVQIGDDTFNEWDTDTELGATVSATIHTWSRGRGKKELKILQGQVYDALHRASLTGSGYNFVSIDLVSSESFLDADGFTRHGVQAFNVILRKI